jgi:hypothetical protein
MAVPRVLLAFVFLLVAACAGAKPTPAAAPPAPPVPPLTEVECSRLFTHFFALVASDPILEVANADFRLSFVEQCPEKLERVRHFDCGMKATTKEEMLACKLPPIEPQPPVPNAPAPAPVTCERPVELGPYIVTAPQFRARRGAGIDAYAELVTSQAEPLEVCGVGASLYTIGRMTCDDGRRVFRNLDEVEAARVGSVGAGGRCGAIIDRYAVACPEKTYDVFVDIYYCLPDAWPER